MTLSPLYAVIAFLLLFAILWTGVLMLGARYGGWGELAKLYPGPQTFSGEVCTYAGMRVRWFYGYNRCLTTTISKEGIHMRPMFAFRLHHPPLLIPWSAALGMQDKSLAMFPRVDITIKSADPAAPFTIAFRGKRLVETLFRYGQV